jgi:anti-sigma factor RsiW
MSDCRRITERLTSYVDGLLEPDHHVEVERHLQGCRSCRVNADGERSAQAVVRQHASRLRDEPLPPGLKSRCESIVRERAAAGARVPGWPRTLVPTVLSVILLVFTASAIFSLATRQSDAVLAAQLTADHSKCFKMFVDSDSAMSAEEAEHFLSEQYGWKIHVPPSSNGVQLLGVRRCLYADGLIPHVMYRANGEDLSLFVLKGVTRHATDLVTFGHRSQIWTKGNTTFVLVSPSADASRLAEATGYMMKEAER